MKFLIHILHKKATFEIGDGLFFKFSKKGPSLILNLKVSGF